MTKISELSEGDTTDSVTMAGVEFRAAYDYGQLNLLVNKPGAEPEDIIPIGLDDIPPEYQDLIWSRILEQHRAITGS